ADSADSVPSAPTALSSNSSLPRRQDKKALIPRDPFPGNQQHQEKRSAPKSRKSTETLPY
ncbi:MAG: hypothetical protein ACKON9_29330, partial [Planctomycetaceae bacterium]